MAGNVFRLTVAEDCRGMRLDQYLAKAVPDFSRSFARKIIDLGGVHLDGRRVRRSSLAVPAGASVEVYLEAQDPVIFSLSDAHILFRDPYVLAVNKPAGIDCQPTPARYKGTLYEALLRLLASPYRKGQKPSLGMVQRLDRDTSGVMIFSTHPRAHKGLSQLFTARHVQKVYLALVSGTMEEPQGEFSSLLARQRRTNLMKSVARGGKHALTRYKVVETFGDADLVEVEIPTGRSHQIRVHFAEAGHPLLGDSRYGGPSAWRGKILLRQMLHAWQLQLEHPVTGEPLKLKAPLPEAMSELLESVRLPGDDC
ncbi:MAG: rRNA synthase [Desulfuromonadales bacterium]|nr:rRNA synthase [Desulfuromonadales bacterium]